MMATTSKADPHEDGDSHETAQTQPHDAARTVRAPENLVVTALDSILAVVLGRLSGNAQERRNIFWRTTAAVLYGASMALFSGELWAGFLTKSGFNNAQIGILASVNTLTNAFGLLAFMGLADWIQQRIKAFSCSVLALAVVPLAAAGIALVPRGSLSLQAMFVALIALVAVQMIVSSIWIMLDYAVLVRTVREGIRGRVFAIVETSCGLLAIVIGLASGWLLKDVAYPMGYVWCFLATAGMILLRAGAYAMQRELPDLAVPGASRSALPLAAIVDVLKMKEFQWLVGPHIVRGLSMSFYAFAIPVALRHLGLPDQTPGWATAANYTAVVLGGITLGLIADRWGAGRSTLLADVLLAAGMGMMIVFHSLPVFLALYFVMHFGRMIEDTAIPFGTTIIVPAERMGAFSAARLMVLYGSTALGSVLFGWLFDRYDPVLIFGIGAALKLVTGFWFWWAFGLKPPRSR